MYADSDALTEVTWYWAADDAAAVEFDNVFYDRTWQFMEGHEPAIGEQLARPPYYRGAPPVDAPGRAPCGDAKAWAGLASITDGGLVIDPNTGLPECCAADIIPLNGGVALGGELEAEALEDLRGGVALGGELVVPAEVDGVALGGELVVPAEVDGVALGGELETTFFPVVTDCPAFDEVAEFWSFSVAGLTDGTCSDCGNLNGDWLLLHAPIVGPCTWLGPNVPFCGPLSQGRWVLNVVDGNVRLGVSDPGVGLWELPVSSFDPLGPNVMELVTDFETCEGLPATITIEPANG
jgi:hypothetical protein